MEAKKYDGGKERFDLMPADSMFELARVYTYGAQKYGDRNWEEGLKWGRIFGAVMRHLWAFWRGEADDKESGLPHLAHAAWGCLSLLEYSTVHEKTWLDNRSWYSKKKYKEEEEEGERK